jgi:hypothetical protein
VADEEQPKTELKPEDLVEAIRRMKVSDLLLSTISTTAQLAYAKLEPDSRDLEQARLAIESIKALLPVLEGSVAEDVLAEFNHLVANLQLAYVEAAGAE